MAAKNDGSKRNPRATLVAMGDVLATHSLSPLITAANSSPPSLLALMRTADLTFANLEIPICATGYPADKLVTLRGQMSLAAELNQMGIKAVSLANNHMMDFGYEGLFETVRTLDEQRIAYVGAGNTRQQAFAPVGFDCRGVRVNLMAISCCLPLGAAAAANRPGLAGVHVTTRYEIDTVTLQEQPGTNPVVRTSADMNDMNALQQAIADAKNTSDVLVVAVHWGVAFQPKLAEYQRPLAHAIVDAGANLVIGHHPHVIHEVEVFNGVVILYSLGNFVFDYDLEPGVAAYLSEIGTDARNPAGAPG